MGEIDPGFPARRVCKQPGRVRWGIGDRAEMANEAVGKTGRPASGGSGGRALDPRAKGAQSDPARPTGACRPAAHPCAAHPCAAHAARTPRPPRVLRLRWPLFFFFFFLITQKRKGGSWLPFLRGAWKVRTGEGGRGDRAPKRLSWRPPTLPAPSLQPGPSAILSIFTAVLSPSSSPRSSFPPPEA